MPSKKRSRKNLREQALPKKIVLEAARRAQQRRLEEIRLSVSGGTCAVTPYPHHSPFWSRASTVDKNPTIMNEHQGKMRFLGKAR